MKGLEHEEAFSASRLPKRSVALNIATREWTNNVTRIVGSTEHRAQSTEHRVEDPDNRRLVKRGWEIEKEKSIDFRKTAN